MQQGDGAMQPGRTGADAPKNGEPIKPRPGEAGERPANGAEPRQNGNAAQQTQPARDGQAGQQQRRRPARLDTDHQGRFREAIRGLGVRELASVPFALDRGVRVPRDFGWRALPPALISLYPDYEGYDFILVRGDIVIIDPETGEIVDVFPA